MGTDPTRADLTAQAVAALTALARFTYTTRSGEQDRYDFGEIACHVITTVAANLGSLDALLAGRPGSWEADHVRQILLSTTPEDQLLSWRTEPVRLVLDPEDVFIDLGLTGMYDDESIAADDAVAEAPSEDAETAATALYDAIEQLYRQDLDAYTAAYTDTVRRAAAELGITVAVEVERVSWNDRRQEPYWDELAWRLHETARTRTPIPATGAAPDWTTRCPADAVRAAGRTYTVRAAELLRQAHGGGERS